jgi:hypothetical protein
MDQRFSKYSQLIAIHGGVEAVVQSAMESIAPEILELQDQVISLSKYVTNSSLKLAKTVYVTSIILTRLDEIRVSEQRYQYSALLHPRCNSDA